MALRLKFICKAGGVAQRWAAGRIYWKPLVLYFSDLGYLRMLSLWQILKVSDKDPGDSLGVSTVSW